MWVRIRHKGAGVLDLSFCNIAGSAQQQSRRTRRQLRLPTAIDEGFGLAFQLSSSCDGVSLESTKTFKQTNAGEKVGFVSEQAARLSFVETLAYQPNVFHEKASAVSSP
jgi:hypothetical protein